jgi:hypothetical protein
MMLGMKTTTSTAVETTVRKRNGRVVRAFVHTCVLECGHVEVRTFHTGSKDIAPSSLKCSVCGR